VDRIFEHVIEEVGIRFHIVIQTLQVLYLSALLLIKEIKIDLKRVKFLIFKLISQIPFLFDNLAIPLLQLLLFIVQRADLFVNLFLHHLIEVLLLDVKLLHDASKGLLQAVDLLVELFAYFHLQFVVEIL